MTEEEEKLITREKHPGRVAEGHKLASVMKKEKKKHCITKNSLQYSLQYNLQYSIQYSQMILVSMVLVCLLSLPLVLVFFLHITLFTLKNSSLKKKISHSDFMSKNSI